MKTRGPVLLLLTVAGAALGQTTFEQVYGEPGHPDGLSEVFQTNDGGYVAAGGTISFGADWQDLWLVRTDSLGDTVWTRRISGPDVQYATDVVQVWDGGFAVCGFDYGPAPDILLARYASNGDTVWTRWLDGDVLPFSMVVSPDSCFVVCARANSDFDLFKVNADGVKLWGKGYPILDMCLLQNVSLTDDGYALCGTAIDGSGDSYFAVVRTDWYGDTIWTRAFRFKEENWGQRVLQTTDGGFIACGGIGDTAQPCDAGLVKLSPEGDTQWVRTFTETALWYSRAGTNVIEDFDGGFLLLALYDDGTEMWSMLIKVGADGEKQWTRRLGTKESFGCGGMARTSDGGLILSGDAAEVAGGYEDAYLLKTNGEGQLALEERRSMLDARPIACISPNPIASGRVRLTVGGTSLSRPAVLTFYDAAGRCVGVWKPLLQKDTADLDLQTLPAGVYCYRITAGKATYNGRVVKLN